jgi:hypothetical protein
VRQSGRRGEATDDHADQQVKKENERIRILLANVCANDVRQEISFRLV